MLEFIRERAKGIVAWAIVILIAVPFALWGINNYFTGPKTIVVAEVNGEDITAMEFLRMYQRQRQQLQQQFGDQFEQLVEDKTLRKQVLDRLIEMKLIQQWAMDHGMAVSDAQLAMVIQSAPVFLDEEGKFSQQRYEQILAANGLSIPQFEQLQRLSLLEQQYRNLTLASSLATGMESTQLINLQQQMRKVGWILFDLQPYLNRISLSDEEVSAYYEAHKDEFVAPEQIIAEYIVLDRRKLAEQVPVDESTLQAFYEENKDLFTVPEQRHARHILITAKQGDEASEQSALKKIQDIQAQLKAGESFEKLAQQHSQDPGSAPAGGDLGYFEQGMMVPAFDQKVFSMQKEEISEPVQTQFGYHLIQVLDIKPKRIRAFEEVKDQVAQLYRQQEADKHYADLLEQLNTQAYEQPDTLVPAAEAVGAKVETSEPVSRMEGQGVFMSPQVREALFSDEVLKQHLNSQVIELSPDQAVVVRVKKVIPARQQALDEVRAQIEAQLKQQKAEAQIQKEADDILAQLKSGADVADVLPPHAQWQPPRWLERTATAVPPALLEAIYKAPKPGEGKPVWQQATLEGVPVIFVIDEVKVSDQKLPEPMVEQLKQALAGMWGDTELTVRIELLKQQADIELYPSYETVK